VLVLVQVQVLELVLVQLPEHGRRRRGHGTRLRCDEASINFILRIRINMFT
jgi:hypothetical protein